MSNLFQCDMYCCEQTRIIYYYVAFGEKFLQGLRCNDNGTIKMSVRDRVKCPQCRNSKSFAMQFLIVLAGGGGGVNVDN